MGATSPVEGGPRALLLSKGSSALPPGAKVQNQSIDIDIWPSMAKTAYKPHVQVPYSILTMMGMRRGEEGDRERMRRILTALDSLYKRFCRIPIYFLNIVLLKLKFNNFFYVFTLSKIKCRVVI
jgi:hypothetical protein